MTARGTGRLPAALLIGLAVVALAISACATHKPIRMVLYQEDDGARQIVPLKSRLAIALDDPRAPGKVWTGWEWDRKILRADGRKRAAAVKEVEGDATRSVLFFETIAEGVTELTLAYCDPLNCEATTDRTYRVKIKVLKRSKIGKE